MRAALQSLNAFFHKPALGLLVIRIALGVIFILAGWNKLVAGKAALAKVGSRIDVIGLEVGSMNAASFFFGVMAAGTELVCGALLILGLLFRPSLLLLFFTMVVATLVKIEDHGMDLTQFGYPLVMACVLAGLFFTGAGRLALIRDE